MEIGDYPSEKTHISRLARMMGDEVRNVTQFVTIADKDNEMYYYDDTGKVWRPDGEILIWKIVASKHPDIKKPQLNDIIHYVRSLSLKMQKGFHPPKGWVSFQNQSLDSSHNYCEEFDTHKDYIINRYPIRYDRKAVCPQFSKFLNQVLPDVEDRMMLLECMAMPLIPHFNFEKAVMFIGTTAANGKSTIMKIMSELFGSDNCVHISLQDLIFNRFMGQQLDNKLINTYADINAKKINDLDKFKLFISGDPVTVEKKGGHPYVIEPYAKHFFSTNTLPEIEEDNNAVYRRFIIIEFPISFVGKEDRGLFEKLTTKEELEGIMYLLLRIAKRLEKNKQFTYEQTPNEIRMRWKEQSNAVFELIEKSGLINKKPDRRVTTQEFYTAYVKFCTEKRYTIRTNNTVSRQVTKLGYQFQKSNNKKYWLGLSIPKISEGQNIL